MPCSMDYKWLWLLSDLFHNPSESIFILGCSVRHLHYNFCLILFFIYVLPFLTSKVKVAQFDIGFQCKQLSTVYRIFINKCMLEGAVEEEEGKQLCSEFIRNTTYYCKKKCSSLTQNWSFLPCQIFTRMEIFHRIK